MSDYFQKELFAERRQIKHLISEIRRELIKLEQRIDGGAKPSAVCLSGLVVNLQGLLGRLYCLEQVSDDLNAIEGGRDEPTV